MSREPKGHLARHPVRLHDQRPRLRPALDHGTLPRADGRPHAAGRSPPSRSPSRCRTSSGVRPRPSPAARPTAFGAFPVFVAGGLVYALGLALMAVSTEVWQFQIAAGVLIGLGIAGSAFGLVIIAFARLIPEDRRSVAFGMGTAAGIVRAVPLRARRRRAHRRTRLARRALGHGGRHAHDPAAGDGSNRRAGGRQVRPAGRSRHAGGAGARPRLRAPLLRPPHARLLRLRLPRRLHHGLPAALRQRAGAARRRAAGRADRCARRLRHRA